MNYYTSIILLCWLSLIALSVLVWENNRLGKKEKKTLYITYILVALAALMEWLGIRLNGNVTTPVWMLRAVKCGDYVLTPIAGGTLVGHFKGRSIWKKLICGVLAANTVFQFIAAFTGWVLNIDAQNHYFHGSLYVVYVAFYILLIILIAIEFITYGRCFRRQNRTSLYSILSLVIVGILMQELLGSEYRTAYLGLTLGMAMMFIHITEFSQLTSDDMIQEQRVVITTDAMTGVSSRYAYAKALKDLDFSASFSACLTVFSIDINGLKSVNDALGHAAGDELICAAADCIKKTFESNGICYRVGGDEFIVLSEMDKEQAQKAILQLKKNAAAWHGEKVGALHLAVGFAAKIDYPDLSGEKLVSVADREMYKEKKIYYRTMGIDNRL